MADALFIHQAQKIQWANRAFNFFFHSRNIIGIPDIYNIY